jgi:hypothetical protein
MPRCAATLTPVGFRRISDCRAFAEPTGPSVHHRQNHRGGAGIVRRVREGQNRSSRSVAPAGHRCCRPASASQPRSEERGRGCTQFARPHSRYPGFRRRGQNDHAFRHPERRRIAGLRRSRASPRPPAPPASLARRVSSQEPCKASLPARRPNPATEQQRTSTLSMNQALPAPTRCASSLCASAPMTACS